MQKKILVTGGCGFIGSHLVERLVQQGNFVTVIDDLFRGNKNNIKSVLDNPRLNLIIGNIIDEDTLKLAFQDGPDQVYHLAAINGTKYFYEIPDKIIEVNLHGTEKILKKSIEECVSRFIFASTSEVYGHTTLIPTPEDAIVHFDPPQTTSRWSYALCKFLDEILLLQEYQKGGIDPLIIRYFNIYGPRLIGTPYGQVVSQFIKNLMNSDNITIHGAGEHTRSFLYIDDCIEGTILVGNKGIEGSIYNIGHPQEISINDLAKKIYSVIKGDIGNLEINYDAMPPGDSLRRCPDITKARNELGFNPKVNLEDGLKRTFEWFKDNL